MLKICRVFILKDDNVELHFDSFLMWDNHDKHFLVTAEPSVLEGGGGESSSMIHV